MSVPQLVDRHYLYKMDSRNKNPIMASVDGEYWTPGRGLSYDRGLVRNLMVRVRLAWLVFVGRADALIWRG